ncbi:hypothetical protein HX005_10815 [Acinetobacter sp. R933-2]|uniref:hypothetical protein n=1 Tax=Acinetobacter sp. R933-2 TaxID=2746728 RepID=UPI002578515A|nr:hypothetical protein [Acinetobacter sp. R933-2]MDM1247879.1 hypothetical protein [Acinetobacter sp. R933-2]
MDIKKIQELALANGFSLKEQASGNMDLHSYVYEFAQAIENEVLAQARSVFGQDAVMDIREDINALENLRNAFEQQLIKDGFVEHSGYSLEKDHIDSYNDERVECAWFACLQGYRLGKTSATSEGFVLVPREAQKIQVNAMWKAYNEEASMFHVYKAIIEAQEQGHD